VVARALLNSVRMLHGFQGVAM